MDEHSTDTCVDERQMGSNSTGEAAVNTLPQTGTSTNATVEGEESSASTLTGEISETTQYPP